MELRVVYSLLYLVSGVVAAGTGAWVYVRYDYWSRIPLVANIGVDGVWVGVGAAGIAATDPTLNRMLADVGALIGLGVPAVWLWFVVTYTGASARRRRRLLGAAVGAYLLLALALVTQPLHGAYYASVSVVETPFPYTATELGPIGAVGVGYAGTVVLVGLVLLVRLFVTSRYRSSAAALLLIVGAVLATLPTAATVAEVTPLPGYDHAALGAPVYIVFAAVAAFGTGLPDLSSVGRVQLVDELDDGIVVVDDDGVVVDHNAAATELTGEAAGDDAGWLVGRPFREAFPALADAVAPSDRGSGGDGPAGTAGDGGPPNAPVKLGDTTRYCSVRVTPLSERGTEIGRVVLIRDVTELQQTYRRLERQNEQLERFASTITHELRNPLMILSGYVGMLDGDIPASDTQAREHLERVEAASDRMEAIVDDLHRLAESGKAVDGTEPVDLRTVVRAARETVAGEVTVEVAADGEILADRGVLRTLLENLLRNAVDHAGPAPTVTVGMTGDGFYVADDGPGIPAEDREQVFEYGYTTADGSGIGLALVRTLADAHGWTVTVGESDAGGTRFEFGGVRRPSAPADGADVRVGRQ